MIAIMVVAHSPLASALVETARYVLGRDPETTAIDVLPNECADDCSATLARRIQDADRGDGVLVLTDLPGASPCNIASAASHLARADGVPCCVLGGVNESMLLRAINYRQGNLDDVATSALAGASQALLRVD